MRTLYRPACTKHAAGASFALLYGAAQTAFDKVSRPTTSGCTTSLTK